MAHCLARTDLQAAPPSSAVSFSSYIGRFAPSPSGALHFGSLVAAVGSYLDARAHQGKWQLRIEDLDPLRITPNAAETIIATLSRFGFEWDGPIVWQSQRHDAYEAAMVKLKEAGDLYPCTCTRREIRDSALTRDGSHRYPGTCRYSLPSGRTAYAWRVHAQGTIHFDDAVQGHQTEDLAQDIGDYVVMRADGIYAYQLAVVVDDAEAGITHIVRGADLMDSTGRQIYLQMRLGYPHPDYAHLPVVTNHQHEKLSKQTLAQAIDSDCANTALFAALQFLGQNPPHELSHAPLSEIWTWAMIHWCLAAIPRCRHAIAPEFS